MKKVLIVLFIILLSSCSKVKVVETCYYGQIFSSFASTEKNNLEQCQSYYAEFESAKKSGKLATQSILRLTSVMIRFEFDDEESVNYYLNKDGLFTYHKNGFMYQSYVRKELFTELLENIEIQKQTQQP